MANTAMFGVDSTQSQVEAILDEMKTQGLRHSDIPVLFSGNDGSKGPAHEMQTTELGATSGELLGRALGWFAGIGAPYIRGIWPFITAN